MAEIRTQDGSIYFYTHWDGAILPTAAFRAVLAAKPRWDDESYATRIVIDKLLAPYRDQETGAGLMLQPNAEDEYNSDEPSVIIDMVARTMVVIADGHMNTTLFEEGV